MNKLTLRAASYFHNESVGSTKPEVIFRKIIEFYIYDKGAKATVDEIIDGVKRLFELSLEEEEVHQILKRNSDRYIEQVDEKRNEVFDLKDSIKQQFADNGSRYGIDAILESFTSQFDDDNANRAKDTINRFLYKILESNISTLSVAVSGAKDAAQKIDMNHFSPDEKDVINMFLDWSDKNKNIALFEIIGFALDYAIISKDPKAIQPIANTIAKKVIYLDSNILFRALGLNGKSRKDRVFDLLRKCLSIGQKIKVFGETYRELRRSLLHHGSKIRSKIWGRIDPDILRSYGVNEDIYIAYINWKYESGLVDVDLFIAHIESKYLELKRDFSIEEDWSKLIDANNEDQKKRIADLSASIARHKGEDIDISHEFDAKYYLLMNEAVKASRNFASCPCFFVSADHKLINWIVQNSDHEPWALLPSHWLSFILRFHSRTENDYAAFVSFLKYPVERSRFNQEDLLAAASAIASISPDTATQKQLLELYISEKFANFSRGIENVFDDALEFTRIKLGKALDEKDEAFEKLKAEHANIVNQTEAALLSRNTELIQAKRELLEQKKEKRYDLDQKYEATDVLNIRKTNAMRRIRIESTAAWFLLTIYLFLTYDTGWIPVFNAFFCATGVLTIGIGFLTGGDYKIYHTLTKILKFSTKYYDRKIIEIGYIKDDHDQINISIAKIECDIADLESRQH